MNDNITMTAVALVTFLDRVGLPQAARDRVIEIDRILADKLASDDPDADGCASLVLEAVDLIANAEPMGFDWSAWDDDDVSEIDEEIDHV